jgi:hypothetical protein
MRISVRVEQGGDQEWQGGWHEAIITPVFRLPAVMDGF